MQEAGNAHNPGQVLDAGVGSEFLCNCGLNDTELVKWEIGLNQPVHMPTAR